MKILLALIVFSLYTLRAQGQNQFATCSRKWSKIGCFRDKINPTRPLPEMLLNDRDRRSKYHQPGYRLHWGKWKESIHSLACRCAEKAKQKGYTVFGLQFYGECWSGLSAELNFNRDGQSDDCIMNLYDPVDCYQNSSQECVGKQKTNYIYRLTDNPGPQSPDVDGGFTEWSSWTECSKTCGGGEKVRERECTNPEPKGNGQPCVGDSEEAEVCNSQECSYCDKKMDVGIIIDSSSSVRRLNFEKVKAFLVQLVDKLDVDPSMTHVGVIHYNHRSFLDWGLNSEIAQNSALLEQALMKLGYKPGGTRTDRAILKATNELMKDSEGMRPGIPHVILVLTDGKTSSRSIPYPKALEKAKKLGIKVIAIGVGRAVDENELTQIAMGKSENVLKVNDFDDLVTKIKSIVKSFCDARKIQ
ncbi:coadhesin-like [Stylophora pistillata]|nr:coadhesin-like [Stylophora pistillata]